MFSVCSSRFSALKRLHRAALSTSGTASNSNGSSRFVLGAGVGACCALQYYFGSKHDIYYHSFVTDADPEDLVGLYGAEGFMDIFSIFPFVGTFLMRGGEFDDDGRFITYGLPGQLIIDMEFEDQEDDTTGDGEEDTTSW